MMKVVRVRDIYIHTIYPAQPGPWVGVELTYVQLDPP